MIIVFYLLKDVFVYKWFWNFVDFILIKFNQLLSFVDICFCIWRKKFVSTLQHSNVHMNRDHELDSFIYTIIDQSTFYQVGEFTTERKYELDFVVATIYFENSIFFGQVTTGQACVRSCLKEMCTQTMIVYFFFLRLFINFFSYLILNIHRTLDFSLIWFWHENAAVETTNNNKLYHFTNIECC